ncbi:MAG: AAA family ATPase [Clostridia bacterium]|nr:AAA family ATPase [Clostridia bacterium]
MKISSVHIASFGKFKDFTFNFSDGFNIIYGDNEDGKTTIMSFIKMMFYGSHTKSSDLTKNLRKKYTPWDSDFMAGSVDFTHNGISYRLEREFKGSSTDKITLINLDLGTKTALSGKTEPGSEFFGLSAGAFEKSLFVGSLGSPEKDELADGEINSKLSNIITTGDEDISFEMVKKRILKAKETFMSKSGKKGVYDLGLIEESRLENLLSLSKNTESDAENLENTISQKEVLLKNLNSEANALFELLKNAEKIKKASLLERYVEVCKKENEIKNLLSLKNGEAITEEYANALQSGLDQIQDIHSKNEEASKNLNRLIDEISKLKASIDESSEQSLINEKSEALESYKALCEEISQKKIKYEQLKAKAQSFNANKKTAFALIIIGLIVAVLGAAGFIVSKYITVAALPIGLILLILGLVFKNRSAKNQSLSEIKALQETITNLENKASSYSEQSENLSASINEQIAFKTSRKMLLEEKKQELLARKEELLVSKENLSEKSSALLILCNKFKAVEDISLVPQVVSEIKLLLEKQKEAAIHKNIAADSLGEISLEDAVSRLSALHTDETLNCATPEQLDLAKDKLKTKTDEIGKIRGEIASLKTQLKTLTSGENTLPVIERNLSVLRESLTSQKQFCDKLDIANVALEEAFIDLRQNYSSALEEKTSEIFARLTDGSYKSVNVSKNFNINVTASDSFGLKDWQYLSKGTTDQAYLSLRLGIASLIEGENEALPIFLDDVLSQYDDKRAETALEVLKAYANDRQIILFTCHSYFADMGKALGVEVKSIKE